MKKFIAGLVVGVLSGAIVTRYSIQRVTEKASTQQQIAVSIASSHEADGNKNSAIEPLSRIVAAPPVASRPQLKPEEIRKVDAMALIDKAQDFDRHDQAADALEAFKRAYQLAPRERDVIAQYAHFLSQKKMWDEALPLAKECIELFPTATTCHDDMTNYMIYNGTADEQRGAIQNCLKNVPDDLVCLNNLGVYDLQQKHPDKAAQVYLKMLSMNSAHGVHFLDEHLQWQLASSYEQMGNIAEANSHYAEACRLGNQDACQKTR